MELRDRLEEVLGRAAKRRPGVGAVPIEEAVPGRDLRTEYGSFYCVETEFPEGHVYGHHSLRDAVEIDPEGVCVAGKNNCFLSFSSKDCIFLDAETTSLGGGSGTYTFLLGIGFYHSGAFLVRQLFMRDYDEEKAVLEALSRLIKAYRFIVTYNGKSFDVPLIESKMVICRMAPVLNGLDHLDLLHAARRVWGKRLGDCRLTTVEERVLGSRRKGDILGEEIPGRYFSYLKTRDASGLIPVFEHNRNDVLFLAVLLKEICSAVGNADHQRLSPLDLYSIGRVYDSLKRRDETLPFYRRALAGLRGDEKTLAEHSLGMACKRLGKWNEAVSAWEKLVGSGMYEPYEELAKYYEHVSKELEKAMAVVADGLRVFTGTKHEKRLRHRLNRIVQKIGRGR